MARNTATGGSGSEEDNGADWTTSRRRVLMGVGGGGLAFGLARTADRQPATSFEFGGEVSAWQGRSPQSISGQTNPPLPLQAGQQYEVVWENLDGQPHNFVVRDDAGNDVVRSDIMSEQGATQTVTFTATQAMTTYLCEVHPNTMVGEVRMGGSPSGAVDRSAGTPSGDGGGYFPDGPTVGYQTVADGMTAPTDFAVPDDGSGRQFVADQTGEVWVVTDDGREDEPFIDVSDRMVTLGEFNGSYADPTQEYDERGLLGIAFHPEYADNRRFFLHYSAPPNEETPDGWDHVEVLSEFAADEAGEQGQPDSEQMLLQIQSPQYNHDAGNFGFGPDGYLYFPMGDGGGADDDMYGHVDDWYEGNAGGNGQDVTDNLMGSILRIDVDAEAGDQPYGIPDDNPFAGTDDPGLDEIYAYGFRNPFGMSFDSDGNLFQADAGQNLWEEVDVVEAGGNYGWNVKEGTHCFSTENPSDPSAITDCPSSEPSESPYDGSPLVDPVVEFPHDFRGQSVGITVVGGHRYEATTVPELEGQYVFGIWTADPARAEPAGRVLAATPPSDFGAGGGAGGTPTGTATGTPEGTPTGQTPTGTPGGGGQPAPGLWETEELAFAGGFDYFVRMFGQGPDGEVYVLVNRNGVPQGDTGAVLRLVPPEQAETPTPGTETPTETETPTGTGTETGTDTETGTPTETETPTEATETPGTDTPTETPTETEASARGGDLGFGIMASLFAVLGSAALFVRGRDEDE